MRLNRFLAATGITSRRGADELIAAGRVTVNGKPCTDFHFQPGPTDHVKVDGKLIHQRAPVHILLNKPRGFVCTRRDPHIMDTIYDLLPSEFSSLAYVGRLDAQSEGLLLLTNDGELTQRLTHPRFKIEKEYEVVLDRAASLDLAQRLLRGVSWMENAPAPNACSKFRQHVCALCSSKGSIDRSGGCSSALDSMRKCYHEFGWGVCDSAIRRADIGAC